MFHKALSQQAKKPKRTGQQARPQQRRPVNGQHRQGNFPQGHAPPMRRRAPPGGGGPPRTMMNNDQLQRNMHSRRSSSNSIPSSNTSNTFHSSVSTNTSLLSRGSAGSAGSGGSASGSGSNNSSSRNSVSRNVILSSDSSVSGMSAMSQQTSMTAAMQRTKSARWAPDLRSKSNAVMAAAAVASSQSTASMTNGSSTYHQQQSRRTGSTNSIQSSSTGSNPSRDRPPREVVADVSHNQDDESGSMGTTITGNKSANNTKSSHASSDADGETPLSIASPSSFNDHHSGGLGGVAISGGGADDLSLAPSVKQTEVVNAMQAAMDNPNLFDVLLVGRDGQVRVPAAKFVLASRNPGLQEKLYEDPTAQQVYIGEYTQDAFQALIEFCHTGEIVRSPLRLAPKSDRGARGWAQLSHLSQEYQFEALAEEAHNMLHAILEFSHSLVCSVYDEALTGGFKELEEMTMQMMQEAPSQVLMMGDPHPGVAFLSPPALEQLLMHELYVNDMTRILILTRWIELVGRSPENVKVAVHCASNIPLDTMDPNFLLTDVKDCGLFDVREVCRAAGISPPPSPTADLDNEDTTPKQATPLQTEDFLYSPADGSLMEESPMGENHKPKKEKRKKSKKEKTSPMDRQCYQLTPDGVVIVCSTDTPRLLPDFQSHPENDEIQKPQAQYFQLRYGPQPTPMMLAHPHHHHPAMTPHFYPPTPLHPAAAAAVHHPHHSYPMQMPLPPVPHVSPEQQQEYHADYAADDAPHPYHMQYPPQQALYNQAFDERAEEDENAFHQ